MRRCTAPISIHAPRLKGTARYHWFGADRALFRCMYREGRRSSRKYSLLECSAISITLREGRRLLQLVSMVVAVIFNPRSREGDDISGAAAAGLAHFNPRSRRRATVSVLARWVKTIISVHAPRRATLRRGEGGDVYFNPRSLKGRHCRPTTTPATSYFNPRSVRRRYHRYYHSTKGFQSALP